MTFTDREKFIVASVVFITSKWAKKFPRGVRQSLLSYIRAKQAPSVTDEEWHEIAMDINEHVKNTKRSFFLGFKDAFTNPFKIQGEPELTKLDEQVRNEIKSGNIDFDEIEVDDPEVAKLLSETKSLLRDYENKQE